jgi:putative tricarboxylic transport membrane protein
MSEATPPRWKTQLAIGAGLVFIAVVIWLDARRLPVGPVVGVGPSAAMRLVSIFVAILGVAHWVVAFRQRARLAAAAGAEPAPDRGNHASLAWVLGSLLGLIVILQVGGGFIFGSTVLFAGTASGFGQKLSAKSIGIGFVLSALVYLFFTKALSLALPGGPLERLIG